MLFNTTTVFVSVDMLEITCSGSSYEIMAEDGPNSRGTTVTIQYNEERYHTRFQIGYQHGRYASHLVRGSLSFYEDYFWQKSKMDWSQALASAEKLVPFLQTAMPNLVDEMKGAYLAHYVSMELY